MINPRFQALVNCSLKSLMQSVMRRNVAQVIQRICSILLQTNLRSLNIIELIFYLISARVTPSEAIQEASSLGYIVIPQFQLA